MGFLGGISWAILVAKICQVFLFYYILIKMFPNFCPIDLFKNFFFIFSKWNWQEIPVLIEEVID